MDELRYGFHIGIKPFLDDFDLVGEVYSCGAVTGTV